MILNHITTKVMGYIRCARESVPHMIEAGGGRIINIGGMAARNSSPTNPGSGVTNSAMSNYSKALSDDVAADGILVNCIHPGSTRTERYMGLVEERAARSNITPEDELAQSVAEIPIGRMIEPDDIANLAAFLCSDLASGHYRPDHCRGWRRRPGSPLLGPTLAQPDLFQRIGKAGVQNVGVVGLVVRQRPG